MIYPSQAVRIVIATKPVDFRKGHDGLAALAERELGLDPHSGIIVVFRAKRGDRIKVLLWDGSAATQEELDAAQLINHILMEAGILRGGKINVQIN